MSKIIKYLFRGHLEPIKYLGVQNYEIKCLEREIERLRDSFEKDLSAGQMQMFDKYNEHINECLNLYTEQAFHDGYCIGSKLTAESLTEAELIAGDL